MSRPEIDAVTESHISLHSIAQLQGWCEAVPLKETSAKTVAKAFSETWISHYGLPEKLTSDRGPQFRSELFPEFCNLMGVEAIKTTADHPQANGLVERFHRTLKAALMCTKRSWLDELPLVLLGLRNSPNKDSGWSIKCRIDIWSYVTPSGGILYRKPGDHQ